MPHNVVGYESKSGLSSVTKGGKTCSGLAWSNCIQDGEDDLLLT